MDLNTIKGCFFDVDNTTGAFILNNETQGLLNYLRPDTAGGTFQTAPTVNKVSFDAPWNEVIDTGAPQQRPIVRIPITGASYLYNDTNALNSTGYQALLDLLINRLTAEGVAVILDLHEDCTGWYYNPCNRGGPMALRWYGGQHSNSTDLLPGAGYFWDTMAARYGANPLVLFELYNEPHTYYQAWFGNATWYIGMAEMYDIVRSHTDNLVVIGGFEQYSDSAAGSIALWQEYPRQHNGSEPVNVVWNVHPYQGQGQGAEHSIRSMMRVALALKTIGPVIWTEFGQYCCSGVATLTCESKPTCTTHIHGDWFVYNSANMAAQYDISWVGWGWRGRNPNTPTANCTSGRTRCNTPDMRDADPANPYGPGILTDGSLGGANWTEVWAAFVSPPSRTIQVADALPTVHLNGTAYEPQGYLPRPCIVGQLNMGDSCGWPLGTNVSTLPYNSLWNSSVFDAVLPGLPPSLAAGGTCYMQACPGYTCSNTSSIVPMPNPCGGA